MAMFMKFALLNYDGEPENPTRFSSSCGRSSGKTNSLRGTRWPQ